MSSPGADAVDERAEAYDRAVAQLKPELAAGLALLDVPRALPLALIGSQPKIDASRHGLVIRGHLTDASDAALEALGAYRDPRAVAYCGDGNARLWLWSYEAQRSPMFELHRRVTTLENTIIAATIALSNQRELGIAARLKLPLAAAIAAQPYVACRFVRMRVTGCSDLGPPCELQVDFVLLGTPASDIIKPLYEGGFRCREYARGTWTIRLPGGNDDDA